MTRDQYRDAADSRFQELIDANCQSPLMQPLITLMHYRCRTKTMLKAALEIMDVIDNS